MPCISPVKLRNPLFGNKDPTALARHRFKKKGTFSHLQEMVNGIEPFIVVPCGHCYGCMRMRCNGWVFRHLMELLVTSTAHFVTLTYKNEKLPLNERGQECFSKDDVQRFWKRLRKWLSTHYPEVRIKYHLAAEYGDTFGRPHYHALLYGFPNVPEALDQISIAWGNGNVQIGNVTEASIRYVVEYITQFYYEQEFTPERKPFAMFSNSLGSDSYMLVARHVAKTHKPLYPVNGKEFRVPKSYLSALVDKGYLSPRDYELIKTNSYEYYKQIEKDIRVTDEAREMDTYAAERLRVAQKAAEFRRKYKLRKQGII